MRRMQKYPNPNDSTIQAFVNIQVAHDRLLQSTLRAGLCLTTAICADEKGVPSMAYAIRYEPEGSPIFSGRVMNRDEVPYNRVINILSGHVVSEVCPPAVRDVPREDDAPEVIAFWKRRLVLEHDITHVTAKKEPAGAVGQSAVWIGYNSKGVEIIRVADGSVNEKAHHIQRVQHLNMGGEVGDVVAVMFFDDPIVSGREMSVGQAIMKAENLQANPAADIPPGNVYLPPLLKASEYDSMDVAAQGTYDKSISDVVNSIIQDAFGVVRSGDPEHLKYLKTVLDNGHMRTAWEILDSEDSTYSLALSEYMARKLGISAVMYDTIYPLEGGASRSRRKAFTDAPATKEDVKPVTKTAVKRSVPKKKPLKVLTQAKYDALSDYERTQYKAAWREFISNLLPRLRNPNASVNNRASELTLALLKDFLTSGIMLKEKENNMSESAKHDSLEWFMAQSYGFDEKAFYVVFGITDARRLTEKMAPGARKKLDRETAELKKLAPVTKKTVLRPKSMVAKASTLFENDLERYPLDSVKTTARDFTAMTPKELTQYKKFVAFHATAASAGIGATKLNAAQTRSVQILDKVLHSHALSRSRHAAKSTKTMQAWTAEYFGFSDALFELILTYHEKKRTAKLPVKAAKAK